MNPGTGILNFARVGGRTVVRKAVAHSPLKLLNPRNHGAAAWVYTSSYGGGLVGGDSVSMRVSVGPGAMALLSTQASTKVYRSKKPATQQLEARVAKGGLLVVAPDPIVCFAGSSFAQRQEFRLDADAGLVVVDWLNAGRRAAGERWAFDRYQSRISIWRDRCELLHESLLLDPAQGTLAERMGRFNTQLLAVICAPALQENSQQLLASVATSPLQRRGEMVVSASPLRETGVLLRIAAVSVEAAGAALRRHLSFLCPLLGDDPWARKW